MAVTYDGTTGSFAFFASMPMEAMTYLPSGVSWRSVTVCPASSFSGAMASSRFLFSCSSFFSASRRATTSLSFFASSAIHF